MEEYLLTSKDFGARTKQTFSNLVKNDDFSDVTLVCGDGIQIKAHKVILSGSSSFFRAVFLNNPHQHPLIYIKGMKYEVLEAVLQFIYMGETRVMGKHLKSFLEAAKEFKIEGLEQNGKHKQLMKGFDDNLDESFMNAHKSNINVKVKETAYEQPFENISISLDIKEEIQEAYEINAISEIGSESENDFACNMCDFIPLSKKINQKRFTLKRHMEKMHGVWETKTIRKGEIPEADISLDTALAVANSKVFTHTEKIEQL